MGQYTGQIYVVISCVRRGNFAVPSDYLYIDRIFQDTDFKKDGRLRRLGRGMLTFLVFASALFASYTINCGINYYRHTFAEEAGLEIKERSVDELIALCEKLTARVNTYSESIVRNKHGLCVLETDTGERAVEAMHAVSENFRRWPGIIRDRKG